MFDNLFVRATQITGRVARSIADAVGRAPWLVAAAIVALMLMW
jgi:hypothetical protein